MYYLYKRPFTGYYNFSGYNIFLYKTKSNSIKEDSRYQCQVKQHVPAVSTTPTSTSHPTSPSHQNLMQLQLNFTQMAPHHITFQLFAVFLLKGVSTKRRQICDDEEVSPQILHFSRISRQLMNLTHVMRRV